MSDDWDEREALRKIKAEKNQEIADLLLDQSIFTELVISSKTRSFF